MAAYDLRQGVTIGPLRLNLTDFGSAYLDRVLAELRAAEERRRRVIAWLIANDPVVPLAARLSSLEGSVR